MTLRCEEKIVFNVNPDPRLVIDIGNTEGEQQAVNGVNSTKNIWDSLQVEVSAEFKKIRISLGELRQITEGLVVELAPIVQNKMTLHVEGKDVALGELVIIGDKYGVKITKVFEETKQEQEIATQQAAIQQHQPAQSRQETYDQPTPEPKAENIDDTDFDFSDFEIEDDI